MTKSERDKIEFQVLDPVEYLPGMYMFKDGRYVPYDGSEDISNAILIQHKGVFDDDQLALNISLALKETTDEETHTT